MKAEKCEECPACFHPAHEGHCRDFVRLKFDGRVKHTSISEWCPCKGNPSDQLEQEELTLP